MLKYETGRKISDMDPLRKEAEGDFRGPQSGRRKRAVPISYRERKRKTHRIDLEKLER
jgi:hypothetical protein